MKKVCYYCGKGPTPEDEMRPYGPNMSWIHFDCMMAAPEREADAERQFGMQLDAAGDVVLATEHGPVPLTQAALDALKGG